MKLRSLALSTLVFALCSVLIQPAAVANSSKEIKSFADAVNRPGDVSYWAWKKSSDQVLSNSEKVTGLEVIVGPNTKLSNPNPQAGIEAAKRLYPKFRHPQKTYAIYYSHKDVSWAQKKYSQINSAAEGQEAKNQCPKVDSCSGASATINESGDGVFLIAAMKNNLPRLHASGTLEAHEYTHVVQIGSFFKTPNQGQAMNGIKFFAPWWFVEGSAELSSVAALYASSFAKYSADRNYYSKDFLANENKKYTEKWIRTFIQPPNTKIWSAEDTQWHLYDVGMLICEVLTAIKGPSINIQIFEDIADGMTYEQSFEKHFGMKWDAAVPLIAKSVSKLVKK